jgi:phosphatidyl-myo-inositol alpha-mannosyltransferase
VKPRLRKSRVARAAAEGRVAQDHVRIAIVTEHYYPQLGGITEHVYGQANELARRGHEVTVVAPTLLRARKAVEDAPPRPEIFEVKRLGVALPIYINGSEAVVEVGPFLASGFGRLYAERAFDVVHVHNPFGVTMPTIAIMRSKAPVTVATIHSVVPEAYRPLRLFRPLLNVLFGHLDAMVAVSSAVVDSIQPHFPWLNFEVVPNGVDTNFFSPEAEPLEELRDGRHNILFIGRFDPRNGLKYMLKAFILLRERRDDVRLIVIGDGPLREVYRRMVPPELRSDVLFKGQVDRLRPRYLASADVLCTPCQLASFGMVLLEAMSAGVAVVASRNSGFNLLVEDGVQGLLIDPPKDEEQFAAALDLLLEHPDVARRMGAAGRERAVSTYEWPVIADQLEALYERLLSAAGSGRKPAAMHVQ